MFLWGVAALVLAEAGKSGRAVKRKRFEQGKAEGPNWGTRVDSRSMPGLVNSASRPVCTPFAMKSRR